MIDIADHENARKARRDRRRVPKLKKADLPPLADIPISEESWWVNEGRKRQIGREACIAENAHALVRKKSAWGVRSRTGGTYHAVSWRVWCERCGSFFGYLGEGSNEP